MVRYTIHLKQLKDNDKINNLASGLNTLLGEIAKLTLYGTLSSTFCWYSSVDEIDYLITSVILIKRPYHNAPLQVSIAEPWALEHKRFRSWSTRAIASQLPIFEKAALLKPTLRPIKPKWKRLIVDSSSGECLLFPSLLSVILLLYPPQLLL